MTVVLEPSGTALRARVDEPDWAAIVGDHTTSSLAPLPGTPASTVAADPAVAEAALLAVDMGVVGITLVSGRGDRGVLAQVGCDLRSVGIAVRALVPADDGSGPVAVPGIEISATVPEHLVAEILRLLPAAGLQRHTPADPVTLPYEASLSLFLALTTGDHALAQHVAQQAGFAEPPEVLVALAAGTTASASLTVHVAGHREQKLRQWLLADVGWVAVSTQGSRVTHTVRSRAEIGHDLVDLLAGAFEAAARDGDHDG
ncbi:hypothetical protein HMPREF0063_12706 [Aeromicrobium marinum DSM 15272]|uniref:ESX secretion-associated protein EspG n=1 Tax=Aeromicrobium marinum DSM 15272 TaxID=585531 RepID=E2SF97_9ACTN|nr:hypothetical protein HMPREF0063_12706 [Aeromicrobium marinum DSM 15272]